MIWRDDDILYPHVKLADLLWVDDLLRDHGCTHTVAIIAETLTPELGAVIRERGMVPQLHCWAHDDLSVESAAIAELPAALDRIETLCGSRPTVLYPPWNRTSTVLESVAKALGLTVSVDKLSLEQFNRFQGDVGPDDVINFHFWHQPDRDALAYAMRYVKAAA